MNKIYNFKAYFELNLDPGPKFKLKTFFFKFLKLLAYFELNLDPGPKFKLKMVFFFNFQIFGRNDLKIKLDHVWTMRGPSFANVKYKRGRKERPPGPEGYHRPIWPSLQASL